MTQRIRHATLRALARLAGSAAPPRPGAPMPGSAGPTLAAPRRGTARPRRATPLRRSLRACLAEGMVAEVVTACAGGATLTAWALHLGLGPLLIGALGAVPVAAQSLHLVGARLTAELGSRRLALWANLASRLSWGLLPVLLWLPPDGAKGGFLAVVALSAAFGAVGNHAWVAWMGELVPDRVRGRYFGGRLALTTLSGTGAALLTGLALDVAGARGRLGAALAVLSILAASAGVACTALMTRQQDPGDTAQARSIGAGLRLALAGEGTRALLAYQVAWNGAVGVAAAFFGWFMVAELRMDYLAVAIYGGAVALVRVAASPLWGRVIDRHGARPVLLACSVGAALVPSIWLLPAPDRLWPLALEALASGTLWSGHGLAAFAAPLEVVPRPARTWALGLLATASGLAFAVGALVGGAVLQGIPGGIVLGGIGLSSAEAVFVLSSVARLGAAPLALRLARAPRPSLVAVPAP